MISLFSKPSEKIKLSLLPYDKVKALQIYLNRFGLKCSVDGEVGDETLNNYKQLMKLLSIDVQDEISSEIMLKIHIALISGINPPTPEELKAVSEEKIQTYPIKSDRRLHPDHEKKLLGKMKELFGQKLLDTIKSGTPESRNKLKAMSGAGHAALKIRELTGNNDGTDVEHIQYTGGGKKGWAWCMYQEQTDIVMVERLTGVTSKYPTTGSCAEARENMPASMIIRKPSEMQVGDSMIWLYDTGTGHVGCFQGWLKNMEVAVATEGNTTQGKVGELIVREGGGSYETNRSIFGTDTMTLKMIARAF